MGELHQELWRGHHGCRREADLRPAGERRRHQDVGFAVEVRAARHRRGVAGRRAHHHGQRHRRADDRMVGFRARHRPAREVALCGQVRLRADTDEGRARSLAGRGVRDFGDRHQLGEQEARADLPVPAVARRTEAAGKAAHDRRRRRSRAQQLLGPARPHPEPAQGPVHRDESQPGRLDRQAQDAEVLRGLRRADRPLAGNRPRQGVAGRRRQTRATDHGQALRTELPAVVRTR